MSPQVLRQGTNLVPCSYLSSLAYKISLQHPSPFSQTLNTPLSSSSLGSWLPCLLFPALTNHTHPHSPSLNSPPCPYTRPLGNSSQTSHSRRSLSGLPRPALRVTPALPSLPVLARTQQPRLPAAPSPPALLRQALPAAAKIHSRALRTHPGLQGRLRAEERLPAASVARAPGATLRTGEAPRLVGSEPCTTPWRRQRQGLLLQLRF